MFWTESAEQYLNNFVSTYLKANPNEGIIPSDFEQDIRNHIEETCRETKKEKIEHVDVKSILEKMGFANLAELKSKIVNSNFEQKKIGLLNVTLYVLFLVIIPQICSIVAWSLSGQGNRVSPEKPHFNYILLIVWALSGLANGYLLNIFIYHKFEKQKIFFFLLNFNLFLCIYYMINFVVIIPLGFISLIFFGFGLLIFAPYINFLMLTYINFKFKRDLIEQNLYVSRSYKKMGLAGVLLIIFISYFTELVTLFGYQLYKIDSKVTKKWSRKILVTFENQNDGSLQIGEALASLKINSNKDLHYKIFGKLPQKNARWDSFDFAPSENDAISDEWNASDTNNRRIESLKLNSSEIDGSFNNENGIAYMEWTMLFQNNSQINNEARAIIKLPKDAVVSRLTLWVNGEEREAAFAKESTVEAAYSAVVNKNRDPVIVQYNSPDTVSMKCFPIASKTPMKIRLGFTAPVQYFANGDGYIKMPNILHSNFRIENTLKHYVWIESKKPLNYKNEISKKMDQGYKIKLQLDDKEAKNGVSIQMPLNKQEKKSYYYPLTKEQFLISTLIEEVPKDLDKFVFIVDFGSMIKNEFKYFEDAINSIPPDKELIAYCIGDTIKKIKIAKAKNSPEQLKTEISKFKNENDLLGGHDFIPTLIRAFDENDLDDKTLFVWVHGDITYSISEPEPLEKAFSRSKIKPNLIEYSTIGATNVLTSKSKELANINQGFGPENGLRNLPEFFKGLTKSKPKIIYEIKESINQTEFIEGNKHQARLWANEEIKKMGLKSEENKNRAIELSVKYQLVTPFVGAVVLENQSQYDQFGLQAVDASTVPSIPEPEEIALIIVLMLMLIYIIKNKKFRKIQNV